MKIQVITLHYSIWSQNSIPTYGLCTNVMEQKVKGKWIKCYDPGTNNIALNKSD